MTGVHDWPDDDPHGGHRVLIEYVGGACDGDRVVAVAALRHGLSTFVVEHRPDGASVRRTQQWQWDHTHSRLAPYAYRFRPVAVHVTGPADT